VFLINLKPRLREIKPPMMIIMRKLSIIFVLKEK